MTATTTTKPRMLDLFSCAGLAADGYANHFDVTCVDADHRPLKYNPHNPQHSDAMAILADHDFLNTFDVVVASPPCQGYSATRKLADAQGKGQGRAVDLLQPVLDALRAWGGTWVVENVERSPLRDEANTLKLCGSQFGLEVQRHRLFTMSDDLDAASMAMPCAHSSFPTDPISGKPRPWGVYYAKGDSIPNGGRTVLTLEQGKDAMGVPQDRQVPWKYLCEGLPPAYTDYIGARVLASLAVGV